MARKRKPLPILQGVTITDYAAEGKALTRVNDMVVFVPFAVPGDVVDLQVRKSRSSYAEAEIIKFIKYSDKRIKPRCRHFGLCGGCKWQNIPYEEQLKMKQKQVKDLLERIGKIELPEFMPILGSQKIWYYRNKLEFGCSNKRWLTALEIASGVEFPQMRDIGFHITGAFDKILPIEECLLMDDLHNRIRLFIREYAWKNNFTFFDLKAHHGLLRNIMIRNSDEGEWMVLLQFYFEEKEDRSKAMLLMDSIAKNFPQITSLLWVDNQKFNDTIFDLKVEVYKGKDYIFETMGDLKFKVGPKSFYQTNTTQAHRLYEVVKDFASLKKRELVYDLYTGTGTIANFVAKDSLKVIGIEYVPEAIQDAKENSRINLIENTEFFSGDMKDVLSKEFILSHGKPDVIITDPPRAGMHKDVVGAVLLSGAKRIVYVSCNPATQARDLSLMDSLYKVTKVQSVDMFPHTPHVENVVLLERRT